MDPKEHLHQLVAEVVKPKTQAQYELAVAAITGHLSWMAAMITQDPERCDLAKLTFDRAMSGMSSAVLAWVAMQEMANDTPENAIFKDPPVECKEDEDVARWLGELTKVTSAAHLTVWYEGNKVRISQLRRQALRNKMFDAIRARRDELACEPC